MILNTTVLLKKPFIKIAAIFFGCAFFISCSNQAGYSLKVDIKDLPDGSKVFLKYIDASNSPITVDSTFTSNGLANFKGSQNFPAMHYLFFENANGNIPVIIENASIEVAAQKDSLNAAKLSGSDQNTWFSEFVTTSQGFSERANGIATDLQNARANGKEAFIESLREEYLELQEEAKSYEISFAAEHPGSLITVLLIERMFASKAVEELKIKELIEAITPEIKESDAGKKLMTLWEANLSTAIGSNAIDFSGPNPNGEIISLSNLKGKVTIIDFWAAWCKPCRAENPNVVAVYNQYHDKGLEIISISLDKKKEDWIAAIAADQMDWHHISSLAYFSDPIAKQYNINAIPATFILDENGTIVAKDLRGPALGAQIAKMLP
ncbi:AhpC/TSA family protein [Flavobacteriaceae bacterium]|nr:AhpC/TSA family protein [Flavobacteriaceae bacterium]MDC0106751.1 AhpC/TSA family protein [Flavobacteriaceae bacterium]